MAGHLLGGCHTWRATGITIYLENDGRRAENCFLGVSFQIIWRTFLHAIWPDLGLWRYPVTTNGEEFGL
jgi:hypothetical protein